MIKYKSVYIISITINYTFLKAGWLIPVPTMPDNYLDSDPIGFNSYFISA